MRTKRIRNPIPKLTEEEKKAIICYYTSMKDNRVKVIADKFGISENQVHVAINNYLAKKEVYSNM